MKRLTSALLALALVLGTVFALPAQPARAAGSKLIAITYDDGPGPYTARLLDGLKSRGVKATFFMVGTNVAYYPELVARAYNEGHQIANHSYNHPELTALSWDGVRNQIQTTSNLLDKACGKGTKYMVRAPYGSTNSTVNQAVGAPLIVWSVDTLDWKYRNAQTVKNNILNDAFDGAVVLVHDIHSTTVDGTLAAIDVLKARGYEFVTVSELFRRRGYTLNNGSSYHNSSPNGKDLGPVKAPEISVTPENGRLRVEITAQTGASIYYTLDGGNINQNSKKYTGPFLTDAPCKIRAAAAFELNGSRSETVEVSYTKPVAQTPVLTITDGLLTLECGTPGVTVTYKLGNSAPEQVYTEPVELAPGTGVIAWAGGPDYLTSATATGAWSDRGFFYRDILPWHWYYEGCDRAVELGLMNGVGGNRFAPQEPVTRAQAVAFLYRLSGEEYEGYSSFPDVPENAYYAQAVAWAESAGVVRGDGHGNFDPDRPVTRQELCRMFYDSLLYLGVEAPEIPEYRYTDQEFIADWALDAVLAMRAYELMYGNGQEAFDPLGQSTRSQAAIVLVRMWDLLNAKLEPDEPETVPDEPENDEPENGEDPVDANPAEPEDSGDGVFSTEILLPQTSPPGLERDGGKG